MRYPVLDGFRGLFLVFMMIIHANEVLQTTLGKINHHYFGFVQDAQGFVFISGFVVAMVYGKAFDRAGLAACRRVTYRRVLTIFSYQAGLIFILLAAALLLPNADTTGPLGAYLREPFWFTLSSLTLTSASMHMGILPMYIYFMLGLPFVIAALARGYWLPVMALSLFLWLVGQTRLLPGMLDMSEAGFAARGIDVRIGLYFNLLAWQILFFGGAVLGYLLNRRALPLQIFDTPAVRITALLCLAFLILLGIFNRMLYGDVFSVAWTDWYLQTNARRHFSPLHLLSFVFALFFISWLLLAGQKDRLPLVRGVSRAATAVVGHPRLIFLGQHSLQVFSFYILLVYRLHVLVGDAEPNEVTASAILVACVAALFLPARLHAIGRARRKLAVAS